ncbi:zinc finger protein 679-like isoform X1 [Dreissena polymorpha]|nr:zinc finger protein 679-like isoform X1 [Dreissena polymorpha]
MDKDSKETTNSHDNSSVKEELESPIPSSSDIEKISQEPYTIRNSRDKKHVLYEEPKEEPINVDEIVTKVRTTPSRKYHKIFCSRNKGYMDANAEHETPSPPIKAPDEAKDVLPKTLKKGYAPAVNQPNSIESPKSNGELPSEAFKNKLEVPETDTAMEVETPQSSSHETDEGEQLLIRHGDEIARELGLIRDKNLSSKNNGHLKKCDLCGYACKTSDNLKIHMGLHTYGSSFKCELCGYACNKKISMKTHMRIHTGERPYKCEMCDHACKTSGNLKTHMRIHTGERPYMCEVCDHACKTSGHLKRHMRIHTEERPYRCEVCDYACNQSGNLKIHMRIHTEERPYKCEVCDHACKTSGQLKIHMRIHTGERPHKCEVCDYHCNQSGYLKIHMRIHTVERP